MNIEQGISISIGLVVSYLIVRSVNYLCRPPVKKSNDEIKAFYKEKGVITREMLLPDIGGYQPIEPRVEYPINNLKEARLMLDKHNKELLALSSSSAGSDWRCSYVRGWCRKRDDILNEIILLESKDKPYSLINQK